ncbi:MAG TPA: high-potential iron-sulfur protein [Rudaea sp.]|nr:high-potential iron-sulfur protein [Rudaea sp.]
MANVYNAQPTRRTMLRLIAGTLVCAGTARLGLLPAAEELPHLTDANPAAASLDYTEDTRTVDARKFPKHTPEQRCANCKFFQAASGTQYAPCRLYPGNAVNENGWCAGYAAK